MSSANPATSSIVDVLRSVRSKGVKLWSENGELHYKAPKGALTQAEIERLRVSKGQIIALLEGAVRADSAGSQPHSHLRLDRAPLAFSQLAHWHWYHLIERRAIRQIASATRLCGRLNIDALRKSIAEIVRRHDALRTRIVTIDGVPLQKISQHMDCTLGLDDLMSMPESEREGEIARLIEQQILQPIDVAVGPLFGIRLVRVRDDEHVLIVAMEHMISDEVSMSILLRELFTAYAQTLRGVAFSLPVVPIQFTDYAVWQRETQKSRIEEHGRYWAEHFAGCGRLRFPASKETSEAGWGTVPVRISKDMKVALREWCRVRHTTLAMSVFTVYVALVLRWCDVPESVVRYLTDGRVSPAVENTVGYFASALYLRIKLLERDTFVDLMRRITEEYCRAHEHADFSYLTASTPRPEFTRNTLFNWLPRGSDIKLLELDSSEDSITCLPVSYVHPLLRKLELDHEPQILLYDVDDEVVGSILFPLNRFSSVVLERFGRNFLLFVNALLRRPHEPVKDILLV